MKRKKWFELEEQTLLTKYSNLFNSGTLAKLKTREKNSNPSLITFIKFTTSETQSISPSNGHGEIEKKGGEKRNYTRRIYEMVWARREFNNRMRLERKIDEERRRRLKMEEKKKEEELE
ncbi:hypothetical protein LguiA_004321 [Lonicera macranthoides]